MVKMQLTHLKKAQISDDKPEILGQVIMGDKTQPICVLRNTTNCPC